MLRALLRPGDAVLTTAWEHSSVVRPLLALQHERDLRLAVLPPDAGLGIGVDAVRAALAARPRLLVFSHASNVTGAVADAAAFCALARAQGTLTVLDASQTAGVLPLDVGADVLVGSAHKSLLGPPGLGFVAARPDLDLPPQKQGGTGSSRALAEHPTTWPAAFEAGTPNTPAILGLGEALRWLDGREPATDLGHGLDSIDELAELLASQGHRVLRPAGPRLPVLSFVPAGLDPAEAGLLLDQAGIHVRTGFHCAPWLHAHLDTERGGTVRISPGPFVTAAEVRAAAAALAG